MWLRVAVLEKRVKGFRLWKDLCSVRDGVGVNNNRWFLDFVMNKVS